MKKQIIMCCCLGLLVTGDLFGQILVPFTQRYAITQRGGMVIVANSMITCDGGFSCGTGQNEMPPGGSRDDNDFNSAYIDIDADGTTFSSSSADLNLAACSKITFAGLYWGANIDQFQGNFNSRNTIKIKQPGAASYTLLTADTVYDNNISYDFYNCFADITTIVAAAGNGTYTLANLIADVGSNNQWGGWGIVIAYRNNLDQEKNIAIFDGVASVANSASAVNVTINGFYTPPGGAVNFQLGSIAYDGDRSLNGDSLKFNGAGSFLAVSDALHDNDNVFNSTISTNGVLNASRNPAYNNTLGFNADVFKPNNAAKNFLANGASTAQVRVTTGGEQIILQVLATDIDTYEPDIHVTKTVTDIDGGAVNPGDTLRYNITVTNDGNDTSVASLITDTLPFNAEYVPGSITVTAGPNTGVKTDATGDDQAEYITSGGYNIIKLRLGNGANSSTGGGIPHTGANSTTAFNFKVSITNDCVKLLCNPTISNLINIDYKGNISGVNRKGKSNPVGLDAFGCPVEGFTSTTLTVPVVCSPPPDSSIGGCLPLVFATVPGIRPGYVYYNAAWTSVTQANSTGLYYGVRTVSGTSCKDTIRYTVFVPVPTTSNAGVSQNICNAASVTMAGNAAAVGTGTWYRVSGPNTPTITSIHSQTTTITGLVTGTYVFRWTITTGCDSTTDTMSVFNLPLPTTSNAGSDQSLCNVNSATMAGNAAAPDVGTWVFISGPNSPTITSPNSATSTITGMVAGVYTFRWSISNGTCAASTDDVQITIYNLPTVANAGGDQNVCNVSTVNLAGNAVASGTGNWSLISGPNSPTITSPASQNTSVTSMIAGIYVFRWTISNGSCTSSTDDIQVTIYDLPTVSDAGTDQSLCNVNNTTLAGNAVGTGSGNWTRISGPNVPTITTPSSPTSTITGMVSGVYVFRWTISNGVCTSSTDDVQITIYSLPTVSNAGPDQNLCNVNNTTLAGNAPGSGAGAWSFISGPNTPTITTPSSATSTVTGMISGVYILRWTISNGVCASSTDDVQITIYSLPTVADAGVDQDLCNVTSANLSGNSPGVGAGTWSLVSGPNVPTITAPGSANTSVSGMIPGLYVFRWTIANGVCTSSTDDVIVTIYALPTVSNAGPDQSLCNVGSVTLAGNNPVIGTGAWSFVTGPNTPTITAPSNPASTITGTIPGVYVMQWTISNGACPASPNDVQITIFDVPTTSDAGPDQSLCSVNSTVLAGNSPTTGTGSWSFLSGPNLPTIVTPSNPASWVTGMITGVYQFRWTVTNGICAVSNDDVQITNYEIPDAPAAGPDQDLCEAVTTTLAGNAPAIGTGTWTLSSGPNVPAITSPNSPTSTITGMIPGTYIFRWTISNGACLGALDEVQINNYDFATTSNAGIDWDECNVPTITLGGNLPTFGTGTWTLVTGPYAVTITDPNDPVSTVSAMNIGTYTFRWEILNGVCPVTSDDVQVSIYDLPTVADAGPDQDVCNVTSVTFAGNLPLTGTGAWTLVSGPNIPTITAPSVNNSTVTGLIFGTYVFRWTITSGVCPPTTDDVQITVYNQPTTIDAGPDQDICNDTMATMAGNIPGIGTGTWIQISGPNVPVITLPNDPLTTITGMTFGVYQFGWYITNGVCSTPVDTMQVSIYDIPTISVAGPDQDLCSVTSVTMAGNSPAIGFGNWTLISGPNTPSITDSTDSATTITGMTTGVYVFRWTISSGPCAPSTDDVQVTIWNIPLLIDAGPDQALCNIDSAVMAGNVPGVGTGTWIQISGPNVATITDINDPATSITSMIAGIYQFGWTITNGVCSSPTDTIDVTIFDLPTVSDAGIDQALCNVTNATMAANVPATGAGLWTLISGPNVPVITYADSANSTITGMIPGIYEFQWTISNGVCASSIDTVQLTNYDLPTTSNAGADQNLCADTMTTLAGIVPVFGSGLWTTVSGPNSPVFTDDTTSNTTVTGLIPGIYIFHWAITNGVCASSGDNVQVRIYLFPPFVDAGPDQNLCNVTSTLLSGNPPAPATGFWSLISGPNVPNIISTNSPFTSVTGLIPGTYQFAWNIVNGVCAPYGDTVQIVINGSASAADAGIDQSLCSMNATTMAGNVATTGNGYWSFVSGPSTPVFADSTLDSSGVTGMVSGNYLFAWTIQSGVCAATSDTVQVTIFNTPTVADAGIDQALCNGGLAAMAGNIPVDGTGAWSLVSGPNLSSIASLNSPTTNISGMIPGAYFFSWTITNGSCSPSSDTVMINLDGLLTPADAGADQQLCNNTFMVANTTLTGNFPSTGAGNWNLVSGPNSPLVLSPGSANTAVTGLVDGTYIFEWMITNGVCTPSADSVQIAVYTLPSSSDAGPDQNLCDVDSTTLSGDSTATGIGTWSLLSGPNVPVIVAPNSPMTNVTNMVPGKYVFGWTFSNNICSSPTDSVEVTINDTPSMADAGVDQDLCNTTSVVLTGNNPAAGAGQWSFVSGPSVPNIVSPLNSTTNVTNLSPGVYTFRWTVDNGVCDSVVDDVQVSNYDIPSIATAGADQVLCGDTASLVIGNIPTVGFGIWTWLNGPNTPLINCPTCPSTLVTGLVTGTYNFRYTINNGACSSQTDDIEISRIDIPTTPNAGVDQAFCYLDSVLLSGNFPTIGTGLWSIVSGPGSAVIDFPTSPVTSVTDLDPGLHTFQWTITNGTCVASDGVQVNIYPSPPVMLAQNHFNICRGDSVNLIASGAPAYVWSPTTWLSDTTIYNPWAASLHTTLYYVMGTDLNGCSHTDSALVEVCDTVIIPDGFTPDGDNNNQYFVIKGIESYPDNTLRVFNRWGNLIYEAHRYNNDWEGFPNVGGVIIGNGKVPPGTYFYIFEPGPGETPLRHYLVIKY